MKRLWAAVLCAALVIFSTAAASANSGPSHWETAPSFSVTLLEDCPITVAGEELSFDFSAQERSDFSPTALVTARYEMKNPTSAAQNVQMAFPLIASLSDLPRMGKIQIEADGTDLPYRISIGAEKPQDGLSNHYFTEDGTLQETSLPSFEEILRSVSETRDTPEALSGQGTLYRFTRADRANLKITMHAPEKAAALLTTGFDGYSQDESGYTLTGWAGPEKTLSLLAVGGLSKPVVTAYTDSEMTKPADGATNVLTKPEDASAYLREKLEQTDVYKAYPSEEFLSALTGVALQTAGKTAETGNSFSDGELGGFLNQQRILVLTYEVPFPANGTREVSVRYPMSGAMDERQYASRLYTYGYLLSPAKDWAGFQDLTIRVLPPQETPYLVKSSIPMSRSQDGSYSAKLGSLPDGDLTFSLYPSEKLTQKPIFSRVSPIVLILIGVPLLLFLLLFYIFRSRGTDA